MEGTRKRRRDEVKEVLSTLGIKIPAGSGQRPLRNGADDIPERTAALEIKQKKKFVMSVVTYRQDWQGELNVTNTHVPSVRTTTVSSMSQLLTYRPSELPR